MPEKLAAEAVAEHQGSGSESRGQPPAEVGEPPAQREEKGPVERYTRIPWSWRPIAVEDDQAVDESSYSISLPAWIPQGELLSEPQKAEALADNLEAQIQPVTDRSVRQLLRRLTWCWGLTSYSEPQLTTPDEVHEAIRGLKVSKAKGPNGIPPNRTMKHLPKWAVSLLARIFNAVLRTHHFPQTWKHVRVISILKPGKDPTLLSSYRPISLLDTIGKLFEKNLPARILRVVSAMAK